MGEGLSAFIPSVCSAGLCWFRAMNCRKGYLTNLQGITLVHEGIDLNNYSSNQLLRKVRVFPLTSPTRFILENAFSTILQLSAAKLGV